MGTFKGIFISRLALILAILCWVGATHAYSQDTKAQEARRAKLQKEIEILDRQIKENASKSRNEMNHLSLIRKKVSSRKELIAESEKQITAYTGSIASKENEIRLLKARLDTLEEHFNGLVRGAYRNRDPKVWYMYILASDNLGQAFRRYGYLRDMSKQMNAQAVKVKETQQALEKEALELEAMKKDAEAIRSQRLSEMAKLQDEEKDSQRTLASLSKDKKKYQQDLTRKQKEVSALNAEIKRIIREALEEERRAEQARKAAEAASAKGSAAGKAGNESAAKAPASAPSKSAKPIDYTLAKKFEANKGKLPWPAEGPVVDHFGQINDPVYSNVKLPNNGINIALPQGSAVKAVFDGEVKSIIVVPGYNKCVLVQHGNYFSFYCKLASYNVKKGAKVKTGQTIGTVDTMDGTTQLHFQIWAGQNPQNPEAWLR